MVSLYLCVASYAHWRWRLTTAAHRVNAPCAAPALGCRHRGRLYQLSVKSSWRRQWVIISLVSAPSVYMRCHLFCNRHFVSERLRRIPYLLVLQHVYSSMYRFAVTWRFGSSHLSAVLFLPPTDHRGYLHCCCNKPGSISWHWNTFLHRKQHR